VPIVILDTEMHLNASSAATLHEAVFYVDTAAPGWENELSALLALPHAELLRRWDAMAERRHAVSGHMVLGPDGAPGRRGAEGILADMAGAPRPAPAAARARAAE
jgi:hypothetical protein